MIANSFGLSLAPHLARCFEHVYFLDLNSIQEHEQRAVFAALIKRIRPDYVFLCLMMSISYRFHQGWLVLWNLKIWSAEKN